MTDQAITEAAARAAIAYRNGDDDAGDYWTERVTRLSDQREAMRARAAVRVLSGLTDDEIDEVGGMPTDFDVLKGHPDHSGHIIVVVPTDQFARLEASDDAQPAPGLVDMVRKARESGAHQ